MDKNKEIRNWAWVALVGILIYIVLDIIVEALSPNYTIREAESLMAIAGPYGYIMNINFLVRGALS